jgi:hypothetical protein
LRDRRGGRGHSCAGPVDGAGGGESGGTDRTDHHEGGDAGERRLGEGQALESVLGAGHGQTVGGNLPDSCTFWAD